MAQPALRLPLHSSWAPPLPRLLQPFVRLKTPQNASKHPQGSANLCQLSGQKQSFPAAWAPLAGVAPQPSPTGLQMAPHGCCFDPQLFDTHWTRTNLPPPATTTVGHGAASLPAAVLWDPRGCEIPPAWAAPGTLRGQPQQFTAFNLQGRTAVPAPPVLPPCFPGYQDMVRRFAQLSISNTDTPMGAAMDSNIPPGSNVLSHIQAVEDTAGHLPLPKEILQDCSLVSDNGSSSISVPGYPGGTTGAISRYDIGSLSLPAELLTPDYSIPEMSNTAQSLKQFNTIGIGPQEPWWDVGTDLPSPEPGRLEKRGKKRKSTFPNPPSKRRALAIQARVGKWY